MGAHSVRARGLTNTAPARAALERRFELEVDPEGMLLPDELAKRVAHAKSLHYMGPGREAVGQKTLTTRVSLYGVSLGLGGCGRSLHAAALPQQQSYRGHSEKNIAKQA